VYISRVCVHMLGSGKSYTMMGSLVDETTKGIIPRLCDTLFDKIAEVRLGSKDERGLPWPVTMSCVCVCVLAE